MPEDRSSIERSIWSVRPTRLAHHEGTGLVDDAIAVCLDWRGTEGHPAVAVTGSLGGLPRPGGTSPDVMT